jgi:uncharacterized protein with HEPN domain
LHTLIGNHWRSRKALLSDETKGANPDVQWHEWPGMQDFFIHAYDSVDPEGIGVLQNDLPKLLELLQPH